MMTFIADGGILPTRARSVRLQELGADLDAVWSGAPDDVAHWMTRPSILRRIATEAAQRIEAGVDRLIAFGPGARVLGAAVALSTGLPFCATEEDEVFGDRHPGESVALISIGGIPEPRWASDLIVRHRLSVVARQEDDVTQEASSLEVLIRRPAAGLSAGDSRKGLNP